MVLKARVGRGLLTGGAGFLLACAGALASATRPAAEQDKIDALLSLVRGSDAVFIRNGTEHTGPAAAAHLKSKLWWAGNRVQTARDFIDGVASRSEESGLPYEIAPKTGAREPLRAWLLRALEALERTPAPTPTPAR